MMVAALSQEKESVIPSKLITDLRKGNVVAWIGAGISTGAGYPTWTKLVENIAYSVDSATWGSSELLKWSQDNATVNPEWVAEVLCSTNKKQYFEAIKTEFNTDKGKESITHAILGALPFKGYFTTNYDTLVETYVQLFTSYKPKVYNNSNAINLFTHNQNEKFIYKIHGDINSSLEDIVLTESDYFTLQKNGIFNKIVSSVFSQHTVVCMGYSLRDKDFRMILEERYQLFKDECPAIYVFASTNDTCIEEIDCYKRKYNLNIVRISPDYNYSELTSTLLSLYCLTHKIESQHNSHDIVNLLTKRMSKTKLELGIIPASPQLERTHRIICAIKDGLEVNEIVSLLLERGIEITSAHVELFCKFLDFKKVLCEDTFDNSEERIIVANHIKKNLDVIPVDDNPRFFSGYYKQIIYKYYNTGVT